MEGFNADWMPTAYDTPAGPDDGGKHDRHGLRPGGSTMVRIIAIGATVCAVAGVGGIILVDRMDMTHDGNVTACERAVSARDRQAGLFDKDSERYGTNIDAETLRKADEDLARRWVKARNRPSVSEISCDADHDNATLKRAKEKADGEATRMRKARRTLKSLYGKASDVLGRKADGQARTVPYGVGKGRTRVGRYAGRGPEPAVSAHETRPGVRQGEGNGCGVGRSGRIGSHGLHP